MQAAVWNLVASRRFTLIFVDRSAGTARRLAVPLLPALGVVVSLVTLPPLMGLGARWAVRSELEQLRARNASLEMANDSYRVATVQLSSQIAALQSAVDVIGERAAVDPAVSRAMQRLPAAVRSGAMGGGTATGAVGPVIGSAFGHADAAFEVFWEILGLIENRLESVRSGVERRHALAAATPSMWPVPGWLSSSFGNRRDPFTGGANFHPGLDISANQGDPVLATADGVVSHASFAGNYGNLVIIDHGFGISTKYGHLSRFAVMPGQAMRRGEVLGYVGSTGRSTKPHLHYEVWVNGRLTNPLRLLGPRRAASP
jgi:murein DD-endopeptidase MepM/ murein hydrolase activator NlpD